MEVDMRPVIRTSMTLLVSKILMDLTDLIVNTLRYTRITAFAYL